MFCKIQLPKGDIHKLATVPKTLPDLKQICEKKFKDILSANYILKYKDSDEELITLESDEDYETALMTHKEENIKTLRIFILEEPPKKEVAPEKSQLESENKESSMSSSLRKSVMPKYTSEKVVVYQNNAIAEEEDLDGLVDIIQPLSRNRKSISHPPVRRDSFDEGELLTEEQKKMLDKIIDEKISQKIDQYMAKITEEALKKEPIIEEQKPKTSMKMSSTYNFDNMMGRNKMVPMVVSEEYKCDGCKKKIENIRYKCSKCEDFDYCENCESKFKHPHPFIKIKMKPKSEEQPKNPSDEQKKPEMKQSLAIQPSSLPNIPNNSNNKSPRIIEAEVMYAKEGSPNKPIKHLKTAPLDDATSQSLENSHAKEPENNVPLKENAARDMATPCPTKKYQVRVIKEPVYDVMRVKPTKTYNIEFTVRNAGEDTWPSGTKFVCTQGIHESCEEEIPQIASGKTHVINLPLQAPNEIGKFVTVWRFQYAEEGKVMTFGKEFFFETHTILDKGEPERVKELNKADFVVTSISKRPSGNKTEVMDDATLMKSNNPKFLLIFSLQMY